MYLRVGGHQILPSAHSDDDQKCIQIRKELPINDSGLVINEKSGF